MFILCFFVVDYFVIMILKIIYAFTGILPVRDYVYRCGSQRRIKRILAALGATIGNRMVRIGHYIYS